MYLCLSDYESLPSSQSFSKSELFIFFLFPSSEILRCPGYFHFGPRRASRRPAMPVIVVYFSSVVAVVVVAGVSHCYHLTDEPRSPISTISVAKFNLERERASFGRTYRILEIGP